MSIIRISEFFSIVGGEFEEVKLKVPSPRGISGDIGMEASLSLGWFTVAQQPPG
jgi:hypothetical protein